MKHIFSLLTALLLISVVTIGNARAASIQHIKTDLSGADITSVALVQEFYLVGSGFGTSDLNKYILVRLHTSHGYFVLQLNINEWTDGYIKTQIPSLDSNCYRANLINMSTDAGPIPVEIKEDDLEGKTIEDVLLQIVEERPTGGVVVFAGPVYLDVNFVEAVPEFEAYRPPLTRTLGGEEEETITSVRPPLEGKLRGEGTPVSADRGLTGAVVELPEIVTVMPYGVYPNNTLYIHGDGFGTEAGTVTYKTGWYTYSRWFAPEKRLLVNYWGRTKIGVNIPPDMRAGSYYVTVTTPVGNKSNAKEIKILELP